MNRFFTSLSVRLLMSLGLILVAVSGGLAQEQVPEEKPKPEKPIQVFILVGQSNMEGKGLAEHLKFWIEDHPQDAAKFKHLFDKEGDWIERDDIWVDYLGRRGRLNVGFGSRSNKGPLIGPEYGFGWVAGHTIDAPVLLLKAAWGGKSLKTDFLPPSAGGPGKYYTDMMTFVKNSMASIDTNFPELAGKKYEIAGFVWFQGFNDAIDGQQKGERFKGYAQRLVMFINDVRKDLEAPMMPFVIGELGTGGPKKRGDFQRAQAMVAGLRQWGGTVQFVKTAEAFDTWAEEQVNKKVHENPEHPLHKAVTRRASDRGYHYMGSGQTYYLMGQSFGLAMCRMWRQQQAIKERLRKKDELKKKK